VPLPVAVAWSSMVFSAGFAGSAGFVGSVGFSDFSGVAV